MVEGVIEDGVFGYVIGGVVGNVVVVDFGFGFVWVVGVIVGC